jgi:hypothetical protein|nr:MAG TPA: hypothetical protein [Caudoviricetes sp.]
MTSSVIIQNKYISLYKLLRNYLWNFQTVEDIAELEMECFRALPDVDRIKMKLNAVSNAAIYVTRDDDKLKECLDSFYELLNDSSVCKKILISQEVVV